MDCSYYESDKKYAYCCPKAINLYVATPDKKDMNIFQLSKKLCVENYRDCITDS